MRIPKVPAHLAKRFTQWLATSEGQRDLDDHTQRRLHVFRTQVVPWLDSARSLSGARILEIGCGTGASTVALAEQGANVTAIDIDEERLGAMRATWSGLQPGALWCSIETPNRLWFFDEHTSFLPFYNWLPDELAFDYSRFSQREPFRRSYREASPEALTSFLRHGRGVSYHEFDLAMKDAAQLDVVSSLPLRLRRDGFLGWRALKRMRKRKDRYERLIASLRPDLHRGFFTPWLDLIIRKD